MKNKDAAFKDIVTECGEDYVGLWVVIRRVRETLDDQSGTVEATLALIARLLLEGGVVAGQFHPIGLQKWEFHLWEKPVDEIVAKIKCEWAALGHEPSGGDIVWFTSKPETVEEAPK